MSAAADSNPPGELYCATCEKTFHVGDKCPTDGTRLHRLKALDPLLGRDLDGRYTVLEKLGQGGMGAVYRAEQHSVGREVAIKVVNTQYVSDPEVIKRFLREAKLASKLAHPNAVAVLDFNQTDDGVSYLVMELVSGHTLDQVIKSGSVFKPERVVRIGTQVLDALDGAHALSIVHRDLKPSNIMLLSQGRDLVKVLDFGLAKSVSPDATATTMTGVGAVVGTPAYMPPELATGQPCDGRADLYSLGVILYLLGSGRLPFSSDSVHELVAMHGCDDPAPPMTGVPRRLAAVIDKLLQKNPDHRYQTAAEALQALESSLALMTPAEGIDVPTASSAQISQLASGATMLATGADPVPATSQLDLAKKPPQRWPILLGAVLVLGVIAFAMTRRGTDDREQPTKPVVQPVAQPELAPAQPEPPPKPPEPAAIPDKVEPPPPTENPPIVKKSDKRTKRDKRVKDRPVKATTTPVEKTVAKPPPDTTGSGSAAKPAPLPF